MPATNLTVPPYVEELATALQRKLRGADVLPEQVRRDRYEFLVIWKRFEKMGHPERQRLVWEVADATLDKSDLLKVAMIITVSPSELPTD